MKKFLSLLLVLSLVFAFAACGAKTNEDDKPAPSAADEPAEETENQDSAEETEAEGAKATKTAKFKLISCRFTEDVYALDDEYIGSHFGDSEDKVYVDLLFEVSDAGTAGLSEENASGIVLYDEVNYDMSFAWNGLVETFVEDYDPMEAHGHGQIHLFASLPDAAKNEKSLKAEYVIDGIEGSAKVDPMEEETDALSKKTELKVGDKLTVLGNDVTVFRVTDGKLLTTDPNKSSQYNGEWLDLVLEITNNSEEAYIPSTNDFRAYVMTSENEPAGMDDRIESEDHTELEYSSSSNGIAAGATGYYHLIAGSEDSVDGIIRLNCDGACYYVKAR